MNLRLLGSSNKLFNKPNTYCNQDHDGDGNSKKNNFVGTTGSKRDRGLIGA